MAAKSSQLKRLTDSIKRPNPVDARFDSAEERLAGANVGLLDIAQTSSGEVLRLPIAKIRDNPFNARRVYSQEDTEEIAKSLQAEGQYVPVSVARDWNNPGEFILIDGQYRKRARLLNGETMIDVKIVEGISSNKELCRASRTINLQRAQQCLLDDAISWNELLTSGECAEADEIAELFDVSKSVVSKTLKVLELPDTALSIIRLHPKSFGISICYELALIYSITKDEEQIEKFATKVAAGLLTSRDLIAIKEKITSSSPRKRKEQPNIYAVKTDGKEVGAIKVWPSGKITAEVFEEDEEKRNALAEKLRKVFE